MFYSYAITVPANTTEAAPLVQNLKLCAGAILQFRCVFPPGCIGLTKVRVLHDGSFLYPYIGSDYLFGDADSDTIRDEHVLGPGDSVLQLVAWNEDEDNDHTIKITIDVASFDEMNTLRQTQAVMYGLHNLFTRINNSIARLEAKL